MFKSKKAQISDTLLWIVATIVIVSILLISIFLVNAGKIGANTLNFERTKDPIATKSISGYLLSNYPIIKEEVEKGQISPDTERKIEALLLTLTRDKSRENWNLVITKDGTEIYSKSFLDKVTTGIFSTPFYFKEGSQEILLRFFMGVKA